MKDYHSSLVFININFMGAKTLPLESVRHQGNEQVEHNYGRDGEKRTTENLSHCAVELLQCLKHT